MTSCFAVVCCFSGDDKCIWHCPPAIPLQTGVHVGCLLIHRLSSSSSVDSGCLSSPVTPSARRGLTGIMGDTWVGPESLVGGMEG